jgi:hypothetical protein
MSNTFTTTEQTAIALMEWLDDNDFAQTDRRVWELELGDGGAISVFELDFEAAAFRIHQVDEHRAVKFTVDVTNVPVEVVTATLTAIVTAAVPRG